MCCSQHQYVHPLVHFSNKHPIPSQTHTSLLVHLRIVVNIFGFHKFSLLPMEMHYSSLCGYRPRCHADRYSLLSCTLNSKLKSGRKERRMCDTKIFRHHPALLSVEIERQLLLPTQLHSPLTP